MSTLKSINGSELFGPPGFTVSSFDFSLNKRR